MAPLARVLATTATLTHFGPWWFVLSAQFAYATVLYLYMLGMLVQDVDRKTKPLLMVWHLLQVVILLPVALTLETAGVAWALVTRGKSLTFQVVRK
jgi:hypothetical protein